jgi:small subunit ribosomal protein S9
VNGKKMVDYFKKQNLQMSIFRPLTIVKREKEFDVRCSVKGGGLTGQAGAIIHGIARALVAFEPELKITLKKEKLTTRDSRAVERKKYGRRKARRSFQFSKR